MKNAARPGHYADALDEVSATVHCIEAGAEDYVPKPFNPVILVPHRRLAGKKALRDQSAPTWRDPGRARQVRAPAAHVLPKAIANGLKARADDR